MPHKPGHSGKPRQKEKFFVGSPTGGEEVTKEEFASIKGAGPSAKGGLEPTTERATRIIEEKKVTPEQRVLVEIEEAIKERRQTQTEEVISIPPQPLPGTTQQALVQDTPEDLSLIQDVGSRLGIPGFGKEGEVIDPITGKPILDPKTGEPAKFALGTAPIGGAAKVGMLKGFAKFISTKVGKIAALLVVTQLTATAGLLIAPFISKRVTAVDRQIQSLDTGLSQIRETITAPVQLVASGLPAAEGLDLLDEMEVIVLETEKKLKELELNSQELKTNPEFTFAIRNRIKKLKLFIQLSERQILRQEITGNVPTGQELAGLIALLGPENIPK